MEGGAGGVASGEAGDKVVSHNTAPIMIRPIGTRSGKVLCEPKASLPELKAPCIIFKILIRSEREAKMVNPFTDPVPRINMIAIMTNWKP